jgi:hypothetical protein
LSKNPTGIGTPLQAKGKDLQMKTTVGPYACSSLSHDTSAVVQHNTNSPEATASIDKLSVTHDFCSSVL